MATGRYYADPKLKPNLDPSLYTPQDDELLFFRKLTGIEDENELKSHILTVQAKAYEVFGYPCIRSFAFTRLRIARIQPGYQEALQLLQERKDPILLDIGCCFGNDARKAVLDGWPVENVIASDLRQGTIKSSTHQDPIASPLLHAWLGFWDYGHELFKSNPETFPAAFVAGDVFDSAMLKPRGAFITGEDISSISSTTPPLRELTSLTPLQGKIFAIHASAFFHLFPESKQLELAHRLASLLSPEKGSVIFGQHGATPVKGFRIEALPNAADDAKGKPITAVQMFCHSPESWKQMWTEEVFAGEDGKGSARIKVDARLIEVPRKDLRTYMPVTEETKFWVMNWCITRL